MDSMKNSKSKARNPKQYQNSNIKIPKLYGDTVSNLGFWSLEFVSGFEIRISNFNKCYDVI